MSFHHVLSTRRPVVLHWPEYLMEGLSLGLFMISACTFAAILEYPAQGMDRSSVGKLRSYAPGPIRRTLGLCGGADDGPYSDVRDPLGVQHQGAEPLHRHGRGHARHDLH